MASLIILIAGCVLLARGQQQSTIVVSGSGSGSGVADNAPDHPTQQPCFPLPSDHPCYNLTGRSSNYALPQMLPVDIDIDEFVLRIGFAIAITTPTEDPVECKEVVEHYMCLLGAPPCDPVSHRPLLICDSNCKAYNMLVADGGCDNTVDAVRDLAFTSHNPDILIAVNLYEQFDCANVSTYYFFETDMYADTDMCTGILSMEFKVDSEEESDNLLSMSRVMAVTFGSVGVLLVIGIVVIIVAYVYSKRRMKTHQHWIAGNREECDSIQMKRTSTIRTTCTSTPSVITGTGVSLGIDSVADEVCDRVKLKPADVKKYESHFSGSVFHYNNIELKKIIGEGAFGKVYLSILNDPEREMKDIQVAIKTIKYIHSEEELEQFLAESLIMKGFSHPHILGLLGVCFDTPHGLPYIILPFMANGSLKNYLKEKRVHVLDIATYPKGLPLEMLTQMCIDIAEGMAYLADRRYVHRDLAARNCMVDNQLCVLIGDFGLAQDMYMTEYYRAGKGTKLPVKWMPPETLHDGISNEKTDVWSFGVTCWEVFSLGRTPYPGIENSKIADYVTDGGRLKKPSLCSEKLYVIISQCWQNLPEKRPTFKQILSSLKEYWRDEDFCVVQSFTE